MSVTLHFTELLLTLIKGNMGLAEALYILSREGMEKQVRDNAKILLLFMKKGRGFSESLHLIQKRMELYNPMYITLIAAAELTGSIDNVLEQVVIDLHRRKQSAENACAATTILNVISNEYTNQTGLPMTQQQGLFAMIGTVNLGYINNSYDTIDPAYVNSWSDAANNMWNWTGQTEYFTYNEKGQHKIYAIDKNSDDIADHFVNAIDENQYKDTFNGMTGSVDSLGLQRGRETRGLDFIK